jgi:hypothetical protein
VSEEQSKKIGKIVDTYNCRSQSNYCPVVNRARIIKFYQFLTQQIRKQESDALAVSCSIPRAIPYLSEHQKTTLVHLRVILLREEVPSLME